MDSNFVDIDILLTRVKEPRSRTYFLEAVRAYKSGALRAAISAAWVAVVFDLITKYRELSAMGDAAATAFLAAWDQATSTGDVKKLLELEARILQDAGSTTQVLSQVAVRQIERLREDRHLCAHPAFSTEADLFEPSPEMARLHLVNAIDLVLSQEALLGKALFQQFDADVQSTGFPNSDALILDYVEQRYLTRIRPPAIKNFGTVLAKSLLFGTPAHWEALHRKIIASLIAIRDRAPAMWLDVAAVIVRLIASLPPANRTKAIALLARLPSFWDQLDAPTRTVLSETVSNTQAGQLSDYRMLGAVSLPQFRPALTSIVAALTRDQLSSALAIEPLQDLWPIALRMYNDSGSYRGSEANFRDLIIPFRGQLSSSQLGELLSAIIDNSQNWDAAETSDFLLALLRGAASADYPSHQVRNDFYQHLRQHGGLNRFDDVMTLLQADGWTFPTMMPPTA